MIASKQDATQWAHDELIPFLEGAGDDLGAPVDRLVFATIVRRAALAGVDIEFLHSEVTHHFNHQKSYIERSKH